MSPPTKPSFNPLQVIQDWPSHSEAVHRCRGTACFAALAVHFDSHSPVVLEARVDGRTAYTTENGDRAWSGIYRRWRQDGSVPNDRTIERVVSRTKGAVDLTYWRDLLVWRLLLPGAQSFLSPSLPKRLAPEVRAIVFEEETYLSNGDFSALQIPKKHVLALRDLRSLNAFHGLLLLAREAELLGSGAQHLLPARCAFEIIPDVFSQHAPLRYRWEDLFSCIDRVLCRRLRTDGPFLDELSLQTREAIKGPLSQKKKKGSTPFPRTV
jgi:hypothetical protein